MLEYCKTIESNMKSEVSEEHSSIPAPLHVEHQYALPVPPSPHAPTLVEVLRREVNGLGEDSAKCWGHLDGGLPLCNAFLRRLRSLGYHFTVRNSYYKQNIDKKNIRLTFSNRSNKMSIKMFGAPFYITNKYHMTCIRGHGRYKRTPVEDESAGDTTASDNKKIGCPAELNIKIIKYFPKYAISKDSVFNTKRKVMTKLKKDMTNPKCTIEFLQRVYFSISKEKVHLHEPLLHNSKKVNRKSRQKISCNKKIEELEIEKDCLEDTEDCISLKQCETVYFVNDTRILVEKQVELRNLANDLATVANLVFDKQLLDRSINDLKVMLDEIKKPYCRPK